MTKQYFKGEKKALLPPQQGDQSNGDTDIAQASTSHHASATLNDAELCFARGAWKWLVARPNVLVGANRRWNKLSLDEVLALPEAVSPGETASTAAQGDTPAPGNTPVPGNTTVPGDNSVPRSTPAPGNTPLPGGAPAPEAPSSQVPVSTPKKRTANTKPTLTTRPRIQVTEETVWQAITGHGVDYKQIPRLEWHLLQGIAPTKHDGILQGDLRRLVGQDKRSVPKRTDFLAAKGYIVKRSIMVRASKTSKLWLAGFAPSTTAEGGEASQSKDVKMTKEILTRDLSAVPWHAKWTGADIDVETFAGSVIAIVKAWSVMRYSDLRLKMGVDELRWQMRVMARLTRNLVDMGIIKYTAATFSNSRKVWKDCVKFIRDPTEAEWAKVLATGKKTSKYTDLSKDRQPKPFALSMADKLTTQSSEAPNKSNGEGANGAAPSKPTTSGPAGWVPEKPLAQTLFDAVDAAGPAGATNPQISAGTVGYNFRRYVGTMLTNMSMCRQPPHLQKFQLHRKLVRVDKTSAFIYTTNQSDQPAPTQPDQPSAPGTGGEPVPAFEATAPLTATPYGFRSVQQEKLASPSTSLSEISRRLRGRHRQHAPPKRPLAVDPTESNGDGRSPKRRRVGATESVEKLPGKPAGAYIGEPGSLNPHIKKMGRPKRSLVIIFKSEKLKDPAFWATDKATVRNPDETFLSVQYNGIPGRLCLNRRNKTIVFSRKPQPPGKEPLTIHLDDLRETPVVRPVPGCDDNSLVFVTKEVGGNPSWTFVFLFKDDSTSQEGVAEILKRIKSIADGEPIEGDQAAEAPKAQVDTQAAKTATELGSTETPQTAEPTQLAEDAPMGENPSAAPAPEEPTPPWKVKGKGKGRGKKNAPGAGQKPWKCEKCGKSWKNDIGLKYHLTKAQVPCNPDFVAKPAVPIPPKRSRRPPTLPPGFMDSAVEGADEESVAGAPRARQRESKPRRRWQVSLEHGEAPTFRGLTVDQSYSAGGTEPVACAAKKQSPEAAASTSSARPAEVSRSVPQSGVSMSSTPSGDTVVGRSQTNGSLPTEDVRMAMHNPADDTVFRHNIAPQHEKAGNALPDQDMDISLRDEVPPRQNPLAQENEHVQVDAAAESEPSVHAEPKLDDATPAQNDTPARIDIPMPDISSPDDGTRAHTRAAVDNADPSISPVKKPQIHSTPEPAASITQSAETPKTAAPQVHGRESAPQPMEARKVVQKVTPVPDLASSETTAKEIPRLAPETLNTPAIQLQRSDSISQDNDALSEVQDYPAVPATAGAPTKAKETPRRRPLPDKPTKRHQEQSESGPTPFKPANHYAHISTDSKIRTAQALDIVEYLLQNNGGIFPGDKALFYAVLRIYLKAFAGQMPPSFKNLQVACRRLTAKGKAREIVHAFRHTNGKFVTCTMLLATEMDPNSIVPTVLKRKMQEAYPGVFIPPAFSPSKEELRLLEEFDREPAETEEPPKPERKFRLRRDNREVEVMNAPYYQENPLEVGAQHHPSAASGHAAPASGPAADEASKKRRKRAATQSVADQVSGRSAKKQKTLGSKYFGLPSAGKEESQAAQDVSDEDTADLEQRTSEVEDTAEELSTMDSTPIANAIKAYHLLPQPRTGPKKRGPGDKLKKIPEDVGRARNPGLMSLHPFFFSNRYNDYWSKHTHPTRLTFLEPNTRLDDYHVTSWFEDLGDGAALADDVSSNITDEQELLSNEEVAPELVNGFSLVPPVTLEEYSKGTWPKAPPTDIFEKSVQLQGWTPSPQETLREVLPADVHEMASWNKRKRVRIEGYQDTAYAEFSELVDRCKGWELSMKGTEIMTFSTLAPEYRFINVSPPASVCQLRPIAPVWDEEVQFTMETFPYEIAANSAGDEDEESPHKSQVEFLKTKPRGRPPGKKDSPKKDGAADPQQPKEKKRMGRKPKRIRLPALEVEREHTAYPQSAEEYMDIHHGAERTPEWNSEHTQLAAFVCVTTLLGGVAKSVDWGLMMRLFPDMSLSHLRKFFGEMNKDRKSTIIDLTEKFQKAFLEAYEKGELPPLDYNNVLAYDWKALTLWTRGLAGDESTLPPSYAELEKRDMVVSDRAHQPRDWRETFWLPARSLYNRYQDASSQAFAMSIDRAQPGPGDEEDDDLRVAMSWVRALCVTAWHPPHMLTARWETLRGLPRATISDLIDRSIRILQERLVITKDKNLIVMRLNDRVVKALDKAAQDRKFAEAARFKRRLDRHFRKGKRCRIPYTADDDGLTMALLNLQAHGRVTLQTANKYVPLGYEPFNYETRKFDRKYHHFWLWAVPTESYLYSSPPEDGGSEGREEENGELAALLAKIRAANPPSVGSQGELPLWVNFFGAVDEVRWRKCLGAVLFILSTRGPMRADAIAEQLKCMVPFEVQMVLDWADGLGLLGQMTPAAPKCVTEWWWLAVEAQWRRARGEDGTQTQKEKGKGRAEAAEGHGGKGSGAAKSGA